MPKLNGQLGTPLDASMASILLSCRWSLPEAMAGGEAVMTVLTGYVGEGCPFTFKIHAEDGSVVTTIQGKSAANCCSARWKIPAKTKGKHFFLAEATSVSLAGRSDTLLVRDQVALGKLEVFDDKDKAIQKVTIGQPSRWKAKAPGVPDGAEFRWTILCHQDAAHRVMVATGRGEVQAGVAQVEWETKYPFAQGDKKDQESLKATSETYDDATFSARFACMGASVESAKIQVKTGLKIRLVGGKGSRKLVRADGKEETLNLDGDRGMESKDQGVGSSVFRSAAEGGKK